MPYRAHGEKVAIHVGEMHAAAQPTMVRTLLGSCIAACLYDPVHRVGGMNHFLLPYANGNIGDPARFGVHAMEQLIYQMQELGADRRRLVGKLFGGGHVLQTADRMDSVPRRNMKFILRFMAVEGIPVAARDLGGYQGRIVLFATASGRAYVRRVGTVPEILDEENLIHDGKATTPKYGDVTLF